MLKVAYILHDTDKFGGAYKSFLPMLYALMEKGVEPLVVVPEESNDRGVAKDLESKGIPVLVIKYRLNVYPYQETLKDYLLWIPRLIARRYVNSKATRQLAALLKGYDIVHSNSSVIDIGARAARLAGIPHVYHFRENTSQIGMHYYPCKKRFYRTVTNAICITKGVQEHHKLGGSSEVIYDCIQVEPTERKGNGDYLFFAGRLEYNKGIEELIDAYAASARALPLWIAGAPLTDSYLEMLKSKVHRYGMGEKVAFLGQRNDVQQLMAGARATIVPSYSEGFGRILPEAMFMRCLTIGRNTTGTKEQYDNGLLLTGDEIGLRFETTEQLTDMINMVSTWSERELQVYTARAYKTVNELYTQQACSNAMMDYYNKISGK